VEHRSSYYLAGKQAKIENRHRLEAPAIDQEQLGWESYERTKYHSDLIAGKTSHSTQHGEIDNIDAAESCFSRAHHANEGIDRGLRVAPSERADFNKFLTWSAVGLVAVAEEVGRQADSRSGKRVIDRNHDQADNGEQDQIKDHPVSPQQKEQKRGRSRSTRSFQARTLSLECKGPQRRWRSSPRRGPARSRGPARIAPHLRRDARMKDRTTTRFRTTHVGG
jgi:hypothetical protein